MNRKNKQVQDQEIPKNLLLDLAKLIVLGVPIVIKGFVDIILTQITGRSKIHNKTNIYRRIYSSKQK
ncbi:hypothetical protein [Thalassotalea crassostreae]|uniref:hypothetical protein n=1 Tax=Thalassotalea crassostreae TaxID=1763536 RepID=UPI0008397A08|nr:hypothetical protein [Thalassotalea crassostreae]